MKKNMLLIGTMLACAALTACGNHGKSKTSRTSKSAESDQPIVLPDVEVKINKDDGSEPEVKTVKLGTSLTKPADPTAPSGKEFYGWMNVKNGGEIWDFESRDNNVVMQDVELKPLFVPAGMKAQALEAELCPDITEKIGKDGTPGMDGETYSGGQSGTGLIGRVGYENGKNEYGASGAFVRANGVARYATEADFTTEGVNVVAGYVHYNYVFGNTLTWEIESEEAVENATLMMRLSGEYGVPEQYQVFEGEGEDRVTESFNYEGFPVKVNGTNVNYGKITIHNIIAKGLLPFRDFVVGNISLNKGANTIQMVVNNRETLNGTISCSGPVIDCIKLYSPSTVTWAKAKLSQMNSTK